MKDGIVALVNRWMRATPQSDASVARPGLSGRPLALQGIAGVTRQPIAPTDLPGQPPLYDITRVWLAAHQYAQNAGYETAIPTFEEPGSGAGLALILFAQNLPWLHSRTIALGQTYEQPTFAEPGFVIRNINRVTAAQGYYAAFATFAPDDANNPRGRTAAFNCYAIDAGAGVTWQDKSIGYLERSAAVGRRRAGGLERVLGDGLRRRGFPASDQPGRRS